jgi:hypothetical protein
MPNLVVMKTASAPESNWLCFQFEVIELEALSCKHCSKWWSIRLSKTLSHHFSFELNEHFGNWSCDSDLLSSQFQRQALCHIIFLENILLELQRCSVGRDNMFVSALGWKLSCEVQKFCVWQYEKCLYYHIDNCCLVNQTTRVMQTVIATFLILISNSTGCIRSKLCATVCLFYWEKSVTWAKEHYCFVIFFFK